MAGISLVPEKGDLDAMVFRNLRVGIPATLFFSIVIPLRPFRYKDETQTTRVVLEFIDFGVQNWRQLPEREFLFPKNPEEGYIDGSLYLSSHAVGAHNPADATRIRFGLLKGEATLPAFLDIEFDFTQGGFDDLGRISVIWDVDLALDPAGLDAMCEKAHRVGKQKYRLARYPLRDGSR